MCDARVLDDLNRQLIVKICCTTSDEASACDSNAQLREAVESNNCRFEAISKTIKGGKPPPCARHEDSNVGVSEVGVSHWEPTISIREIASAESKGEPRISRGLLITREITEDVCYCRHKIN